MEKKELDQPWMRDVHDPLNDFFFAMVAAADMRFAVVEDVRTGAALGFGVVARAENYAWVRFPNGVVEYDSMQQARDDIGGASTEVLSLRWFRSVASEKGPAHFLPEDVRDEIAVHLYSLLHEAGVAAEAAARDGDEGEGTQVRQGWLSRLSRPQIPTLSSLKSSDLSSLTRFIQRP